MLSYILRRLLIMIPTLFGVTVVSFCVMQLAPGDPVLSQLNGASGQSTQTPDAYQLQKHDLHLDKPLVLNFRYFHDYSPEMAAAAHYLSLTSEEILAELPSLAERPDDPTNASRLRFLRGLQISEFTARLIDSERRENLSRIIPRATSVLLQDIGENGVRAGIELLQTTNDQKLKLGAINCLGRMVPEPFKYVYTLPATDAETPDIVAVWKLWWGKNQDKFPPLEKEAREWLAEKLADMAKSPANVDRGLTEITDGNDADSAPRFFAEKLLRDSSLAEKVAASAYLKNVFSKPLVTDLPLNAGPADIAEAESNWMEHERLYGSVYRPGLLSKLGYVVGDTQYAFMLKRLVTFDFGRSTIKTHDPVSKLIWEGFVVSAPLVFLSELLIYLVAVPLGILCGAFRGTKIDRGISLVLFLLYSIPPFVAAMLFLVYFCFGDYLTWFPMYGLHSQNADNLSWLAYLGDYLWHAFLPVVCLSLFSLAAIAMYSRSSILDVIGQDYIRTARAKGLSEPVVILKHGLRNAMIPILTLFSSFLPAMLGGSILIEVLFSIPGLGWLGFNSIEQKDFPTVMALLYIEAIVTLISFLITDLLYVVVDPRISFSGRGRSA